MNFAMDTLARAESLVFEWLDDRGLKEAMAPMHEVAITWVKTNAPKQSSSTHLALATMDLYLWFLQLDEQSCDDMLFFGRIADILDGQDPQPSSPYFPLEQLYSDHLSRIAGLGHSTTRYCQERQLALSTYIRRNEIVQTSKQPSFDEFLEIRSVTTLFRVWYTLWEILANFKLTQSEYQGGSFAEALSATCEWQVYINEIASLDRDRQEGMPNLIDCLRRDRGHSESQAIEWTQSEMSRLEALIRDSNSSAVDLDGSSGNLEAAHQFLIDNLDGSRQLYQTKLSRYTPRDFSH
ncbi:hypothetical protein G6O69_07395 [Pseudenhygromyxa sp. WMMC2535]|uniref:terpene synthase family protein n=1 Tax=Pseudenhygromyxa sp. WMMC2535 TaxID=2712867 RepID=UPI0015959F3D|nr:terpene synthase family protein [Pseudenhygromyxa sp. WMMC2535]NVB37652.1 hypothetical protein [Pseudenhygromyxa sp. WMMC2535]